MSNSPQMDGAQDRQLGGAPSCGRREAALSIAGDPGKWQAAVDPSPVVVVVEVAQNGDGHQTAVFLDGSGEVVLPG